MSKEKQNLEWLEKTVSFLEMQIVVSKACGETSISMPIDRAEHYLGLCAALIKLNSINMEKRGEM